MTDNPRLSTGRRWAQLALIAAVVMYGIVGFPNPVDPELPQASAHPPDSPHTPPPKPKPKPPPIVNPGDSLRPPPPKPKPPPIVNPGDSLRPPPPKPKPPPIVNPGDSLRPPPPKPKPPPIVNPGDSLRPPPPQNNNPVNPPVNNRPVNNRPVNNRPVNNNPVNPPVNNRPVNNRPVNNRPVNNNPVNPPVNNRPVNNRPVVSPPVSTPPQKPCDSTNFGQSCENAVQEGWLTEEESYHLEDSPTGDRLQKIGEQFDDSNLNVDFDEDAYADELEGVHYPPPRKNVGAGICEGLASAGCPSSEPGQEGISDEQIEWLHENEITYLQYPEGHPNHKPGDWQHNFGAENDATYGHTVAFLDRIEDKYGNPGFDPPGGHPPVNNNPVNNNPVNNNAPDCDNGLTVVVAHIGPDDDGCRPPSCDFGRAADGWCLPPTNFDTPVIYVLGPGDVDEDEGTASFRVVLSHAITQPISITVATADGTATAGSDYTRVSRRITLPANHTVRWVSVSVTDDTRDEPDETFMLQMSNPSANAQMSTRTQAEATIADDDQPAFLGAVTNLTAVCVSGQITLSWGPPAGSNSVNDYRYGIYRDPYLVRRIASGTTTDTQVTVDVTDTTLTYYADIQARGGLNPDQAGWLETDGFTCTVPPPVVSLAATSLSVGENSSVQITATLDVVPSSTASVRFILRGATNGNGSCSTGADFYVSGTGFTFTNTTSASITLTACDDTDTTDETVTLALTTTGITGLELGSSTTVVVSITDDDTAPAPLLK